MQVHTEDPHPYFVTPDEDINALIEATIEEDAIIHQALGILRSRFDRSALPLLDSPTVVRDYLTLRVGALEHEVFGVLWLDCQNRLIDAEELFRGTLTQTSVYPREVAKQALARNAGAVVLYHNHPSGCAEPSTADIRLTEALKKTLALFEVRTLDHFVITTNETVSFAERGLL